MAVLAAHIVVPALNGQAPVFITKGYLAVDLFFVLSGFVLAHAYQDDFAGKLSARAVGFFLWARLARIYPVHLFTIIPYLSAYGRTEMVSGTSLVYNLLLIQSPWLTHLTWNQYAWSISAEWHAYLLFPFVAGFLRRCDRGSAVAVACASLATLGAAVFAHTNSADITFGPLVLARTIPEFLAGALAYRAYKDGWLASIWRTDAAFFVVAAAIIALAQFKAPDLAIITLLPALLLTAAHNTGRTKVWLNVRPLQRLGEISYSVYMAQGTAIILSGVVAATAVGPVLGVEGMVIFGFALAITLGTLIHRRIERPARELMRRAQSLFPMSRGADDSRPVRGGGA
jgi:peptidoglycan/LPS O-acetylase OafA/YrhL